jgi:hypothetical protein
LIGEFIMIWKETVVVHYRGTVPEYVKIDCRKPRKPSLRIADVQAKFEPSTPQTEVQSITGTKNTFKY